MLQFEVQVGLVAIQVNLEKVEPPLILSTNPDKFELPTKIVKYKTDKELLKDIGQELCKQHIGLEPEWVELTLIDVETFCHNIVLITYGCLIPYGTKIINSHWIEINPTSNDDKLDIVTKTLQKLGNIS